jgi:hypothetical protein
VPSVWALRERRVTAVTRVVRTGRDCAVEGRDEAPLVVVEVPCEGGIPAPVLAPSWMGVVP